MSSSKAPWLHNLVTVLGAPTVVLSDPSGQIRAQGAQGVIHADIRVLSQAVLTVNGTEPSSLGGGVLDAHTARFSAIDIALDDDAYDPTMRVERERTALAGMVSEQIRLVSFTDYDCPAEVSLTISADLANIQDIRSDTAIPSVPIEIVNSRSDGNSHPVELEWGSECLRVHLTAPDALASADTSGCIVLRWPGRVRGRGELTFNWRITVDDPSAVVFSAPNPGASWNAVSANADDPRLARLLARSLADAEALRMVSARAPDQVFLAAGAPWYLTLFGRDSIWAARMLLPLGWDIAASTLRALAAYQGTHIDQVSGEVPGKFPHELRRPMSDRSGAYPRFPELYYGTIDATPLWVCLLHDAWRWGMPAEEVFALLPNMIAALECIRDYGDPDGDGLLEYIDESGQGLANQGWKDSGDSARFANGQIANPPIALCEVQGYAYEAAVCGAELLEAFRIPGGEQWRDWAAELASAFRASFWVSDEVGPYPAFALDGSKRRVDSLTSNIGHLLGTGLLTPAEEHLVATRVTGADMDSGFGLRTMSALSDGYSPLSYHCGSVWSHDTAIVIWGLCRAGHAMRATSLVDGLLEAASAFDWRLPELFSGDPRPETPWPTPYPSACRPQAWAAAAVGALLQALLGLQVHVPAGVVEMTPPGVALGGAGLRLHVSGLRAGEQVFNAGVDRAGRGYMQRV